MDESYVKQLFAYIHLPPVLQVISEPFYLQAMRILTLPKNPEQTIALRKLLEAKDAAVRCAVIGGRLTSPSSPPPADTAPASSGTSE